jgi:hypothetical protein
MFTINLTRLWIIVVCSLSSYTFAAEDSGMSDFFADERNKIAFNNAVKGGMMEKSRDQMMEMCKKGIDKKETIDCECLNKELKKITDEELFYESVTSYREYQERVQAAKDNDQAKLEKLKQKHANRIGMGKKIDKACGNK